MLTIVKLIAIRPLTGDYNDGKVVREGQSFECDSATAHQLQSMGVARPDYAARRAQMADYMLQHSKALPAYENKALTTPENKDASGIGDHADTRPPAVHRESDPVLSRPNISAQGTRNRR